jgi:Delta3-Delta2-enoyl-CoA isomerase
MPTIALVNGHAFAGGLMLAMYHDYRIFNPSRGFLCLNELEFGAPLKPAMSSIFRQKIPYPATYRSLVLEAKRFSGNEALEGGIVDGLGAIEDVLALVNERKLVGKGTSGVYGLMKWEMYRETVGLLDGHYDEEKRVKGYLKINQRSEEQGKLKEWQKKRQAKI